MAAPTDICTDAHTYVDYDIGQNFWNYFAINFVSAISNYVPPNASNEMASFLFFDKPFSDAAHEVLIAQPTFIVFFWLGVIISVVSIVAAIVFLFPCARKWSTKHVSAKCMGATGLALSVVSFCFILWGTAMFILAHISAISNDRYSMDNVYKNINSFTTTKNQTYCFSKSAFDPMFNQTGELPNKVIASFETETGLLGMMAVNSTALATSVGNTKDVNTILQELKDAAKDQKVIDVDEAAKQVQSAIDAFTDILDLMTKNGGLSKQVKDYDASIKSYKTSIETYINAQSGPTVKLAGDNIYEMSDSVERSIRDVSDAMANTTSLIQHAAARIDSARAAAAEIDSNWLVPRWLLFIPLFFAVFTSLIAIGFGAYYSCTKHQHPHKGMSCALVTFAIIILALTSVVTIPTIAGMSYGYSTQASFDPFFNDYNLKGLHTGYLRNFTFKIESPMNEEWHILTTFADILTTCKHEDVPFFTAAVNKDGAVVDEAKVGGACNYDALFDMFEATLNDGIPTPITNEGMQSAINDSLTAIAIDLNSVDLSLVDKDAAKDALADIKAFTDSLIPLLNSWITAYEYDSVYRFTDLTNATLIHNILGDEMSPLLLTLDNNMQKTAKTLHSNLYENGESCKNLYKSYGTAGDLATVDTAAYANGMWTAAGLAALFFIPLALSLLLLANAYRHGHGHHSVPAPVAKQTPAPAPAPIEQHHIVHTGPPVAPARNETAPAVPARSSSAWQQPQQSAPVVYMPTDSYAPQPVQQFVDPLAAPAPAVYRRVGSPTQDFYPYPNSTRH